MGDEGVDVESRNGDGMTPLMVAAGNGNDAAKLLIGRGAHMHVKDYEDSTPLDDAKDNSSTGVVAIIEAAIKSTKAIYASSNELQQNRDNITFRDFNNNIIILSDNDILDGFEFEGHPIITLRHLRECTDQLPTSDNDDDIHRDAIHNILAEKHPAIAKRLQYWGMNLLHLITYFPQVFSNDAHEAISSLLTIYPQASKSADIDGMTPLHHAVINLSKKKTNRECHDLLLERSPPIVVHRAIEA